MRQSARRFAGHRGGNFAIMASVLAVPLVMAAGVAVDLSTISRTRAELQQAMDSAVLAVAREGTDVDDVQARQIAMLFVANNYHLQYTNLDVVRRGSGVTVEARTRVPMAFGGLLGYSEWPVTAVSSADIAYASYEIALVLDTTGSMAGGKLTAMKDAVDGMIESMAGQVKDRNRLRFSLVPFATFVNVGPEHGPKFDHQGLQIAGTGASWLDLEGRNPIPQKEFRPGASRFQAYRNMNKSWTGCVETRPVAGGKNYDVEDIAANPADPRSLFVPAFAIDEPDTGGYANNYIASGVDPFDDTAAARKAKLAKYGLPTDNNGEPLVGALLKSVVGVLGLGGGVTIDDSGGKGPGFGCGTQPLTPLSNDYAMLRNKVKQLNAQGTTNIMEGVAWGTRVLSSGEPFGQGAKKGDFGIEKIMVVLTDGSNVMGNNGSALGSGYSSFGFASDGRLDGAQGSSSASNAAMNARTLAACTYAKNEGITVYTIRLEEPDVKTGNMLQQCASSADHFFDAPSRTQLDDVFKVIRDRVIRLRLSS